MTFVDLDKGGNVGYTKDLMDMGPTSGRQLRPTRLPRTIAIGVASTLQKWDAWIFMKLPVGAAYALTLLPVREWMANPYGQIEVLVKFLNDNGGFPITILPTAPDTIDGIASVQIAPQVGLAPFPSLIIRPRADLLGWIIT